MPNTRKTNKRTPAAAPPSQNASRKTARQPGLPRARGEETRARLLQAAYDEFLRRGYHGTSMRQIAAAAGVAVGGIYNHFANKEAIFAAVLDANHPYHVILPALEQTQGDSLEDFMRDAARLIQAEVLGVEEKLMPLAFIEVVEFQGRHLKELAEKLFPPLMGFVQRLNEQTGQLRNVPVPVVLRTFLSLMIGYMFTQMVLKNSPLLDNNDFDWFGGMVDIYLHGIAARPPR